MPDEIKNNTQEQQNKVLDLFRATASPNFDTAKQAALDFAEAIQTPLRETIMVGDNLDSIFSRESWVGREQPHYPLDLINPNQAKDFTAFVYAGEGELPRRVVNGSEMTVPTFDIANVIDVRRGTVRDGHWNIVGRVMEILEGGIIQKINDEGWQTILQAGKERGIVIGDVNATAGQFTPALLQNSKLGMARLAGGNATSKTKGRLTDVYCSLEAQADVYNWKINEVADEVRKNIFYSQENGEEIVNIYGVKLHAMHEFGEGQDYQTYYTGSIGGQMAASDTEIMIGLDRSKDDSFLMPYREELVVQPEPFNRLGLISYIAFMNAGFAVLDSRRVVTMSI